MIKAKKILILTSKGGTGQQSICQAMHEYLGELYELNEVNVTTEVMMNFDPLSYLHKKLNTEVVYNWLIKKNYFFMLNMFVRFGGFLMKYFLSSKVQGAFQTMFIAEKPDLVISLVPYYNAYAIKALDNKKLYIIVCCDIDIKGYLFDWPKKHYNNLSLFLPISTDESSNYLNNKYIQQEQVHIAGYPLRKSFCDKNSTQTKNNTITLLLGGQGSEKCLQYLKKLITYKNRITINVCIGYNKNLASRIKTLVIPENITINIIAFTDNIAHILLASDLLITKTGSCSIFEALSLHKPILMDCTSTQLFWERANIDYVEKIGVGLPVVKLDDCVSMVNMLLDSENKLEAIAMNYHKHKMPDFFKNFTDFLSEKVFN
jgi:UDP-N-acetylglucosamine:LPS N-acetylglucosamine transferase